MVGTMLNLALNAIGAEFNCSAHDLGWVSSIYFIVSVMALVPTAKLSDIYGKKKMFMTGIVIATVGLIFCSTAQNIYSLYVFRGVCGVGMAMISGTSVSMISDVYPKEERGAALGVNTASVYLGAALGPSMGGFITDLIGWRWIFVVIVPLMLVGFFAIMRFPYNIKNSPGQKYDMKGAIVYVIGIGLMMFGLISLPEIYAMVMMFIGGLFIMAFIFIETHEEFPLMQMKLFRNSRFSRSLLALFLNYASSYCTTFFLSLYLQNMGAMTATQAGLVLMAQPVMQVIFTLLAGKLSDRIDKRILPTLGMLITAVSLFMLLTVGITLNLPLMIAALIVGGIGYGVFSAPNTSATMSYVQPYEYNQASAMIATMRQIGMMLSMGVATCLISIHLGSTAALEPSNYPQFMEVMKTAWIMCISFSLVGAVISWFRGKSTAGE